jgi:hypothetical protein
MHGCDYDEVNPASDLDICDLVARDAMWPLEIWLSRVGLTFREREGYVPLAPDLGPRGARVIGLHTIHTDTVSGEL